MRGTENQDLEENQFKQTELGFCLRVRTPRIWRTHVASPAGFRPGGGSGGHKAGGKGGRRRRAGRTLHPAAGRAPAPFPRGEGRLRPGRGSRARGEHGAGRGVLGEPPATGAEGTPHPEVKRQGRNRRPSGARGPPAEGPESRRAAAEGAPAAGWAEDEPGAACLRAPGGSQPRPARGRAGAAGAHSRPGPERAAAPRSPASPGRS